MLWESPAAVEAYEAGSLGYSINAQVILLLYVLGAVKERKHQQCRAAAWHTVPEENERTNDVSVIYYI
jgi:hypothetical protein